MNPLAILLADDDEDVRVLFETALKRRGHRVVTAATGREALALLATEKFDVLVTDIVMPEVDGLDLIKAARKLGIRLRIIAVTGGGHYLNGKYCANVAEALGADMALMKPILPAKLAQILEQDEAVGTP
jgi:CheY-like chemotaxis protein